MPVAQAVSTMWVAKGMLVYKPGYLLGLYVSSTQRPVRGLAYFNRSFLLFSLLD